MTKIRTEFKFYAEIRSKTMPDMKVILGSHTVKAFVVAPRSLNVIGVVKFGMEFGLLAKAETGEYARVNGSTVIWLNKLDVEEAIYRTKHFGRGESFAASRLADYFPMRKSSPIILLKKHRRIDPILASNSEFQRIVA